MSVAVDADRQAILLLCAPIESGGAKPLTLGEWAKVAAAVHQSELERPAALLGLPAAEIAEGLGIDLTAGERVAALLDRGGPLAFELERLASRGLWMLTRVDYDYPERLKRLLGLRAPPVLTGAGSPMLLRGPAIAIVGSRDAEERALEFAGAVAMAAARAGAAVVSGAARGVDRTSMSAALDAGGAAVGVVADSLLRLSQQPDVREPLTEGQLALVTPHRYDARFQVGNAMGRNKLIYCLSDAAVIVASARESGGTWAGAVETIAAGWVPVWAWDDPSAPEGNQALIERGARPLKAGEISGGDLLERLTGSAPTPRQGTPNEISEDTSDDLFALVWPRLEQYLRQPRREADVARHFDLRPAQVKAWLERGLADGLLVRGGRPVRYRAASAGDPTQPRLFEAR